MNLFANLFVNRVLHKTLWAVLLPVCALWGLAQAVGHRHTDATPSARSVAEWPSHWQGQALRPLALSDVEQRFAQHFPGTVTRLTTGSQVLVLRTVGKPTRMLHPATDCYRALGYRIHSEQLERQAAEQLWRCFVAERAGRQVRVCERIEDAQGHGYTDASAWYWASIVGQSTGPWLAYTVATPL
ncbi:hypothetical protein KIK84_09090 [Curvibacter sp. CHRR-16]|uniref:hypothetical protein n=1 Tax=Curvibacter sp. CHRR-16 TaxID=2835872 RepID=UPI001BD958EE|nr:hypothetical protein [Curvibacter sp. CHRR-16]MBT0570483.1 hypothetical protein [Curvibacter sp. CHRR-16]